MTGLTRVARLLIMPLLASLLFSGAFLLVNFVNADAVYAAKGDKYLKTPKLVAKSAILIDAKTGDVLYEKKADAKREPASCTKVLTALLAIENFGPDEVVTVTDVAPNIEGSSVGLVEGEEIRSDDLLYAAMLESGNDAAAALAVGVDGSIKKFAKRMNNWLADRGLTHSHFMNPHGLEDPEHYTTARDLAAIAREAMKNESFRKYVSTYTYTMPRTNIQPKRLLHNGNRLLYDDGWKVTVYGDSVPIKTKGVTGIKTGFTDSAGNCLVAGIKRDGMELISVVLKSSGMNHYSDTLSLFEYGLRNFEEKTFQKKGDTLFERPVVNSVQKSMNIVLAGDLTVTVNKNKISDYSVDGEVTEETTGGGLLAPLKAGDKLGSAWVKTKDGDVLATVDLVAENSMSPNDESVPLVGADSGADIVSSVLWIVGIVVLAAALIVVVAVIRSAVRTRRRRRNRMYGAKLKDSVDPREVRRIKNLNRPRRR